MVSSHDFDRFNIYDIFSTFLPGSVLLIGVAAPLVGLEVLLLDLSIGGILVLIILSFGTGLGIQALATYISSASSGFSNHMDNVFPEEDPNSDEDPDQTPTESPIGVNSIDYDFYQKCKLEYNLSADFNDWDRLFKLVLTDLEGNDPSRALRMQALYLGMRGMVVTTAILAIYFTILSIISHFGSLQLQLTLIEVILLAAISGALAILACIRQDEFRDDVLQYMIGDFCIIMDLPDDSD